MANKGTGPVALIQGRTDMFHSHWHGETAERLALIQGPPNWTPNIGSHQNTIVNILLYVNISPSRVAKALRPRSMVLGITLLEF